ncbi:hypothetical protein [Rhizobium sp. CFBP 8762]
MSSENRVVFTSGQCDNTSGLVSSGEAQGFVNLNSV